MGDYEGLISMFNNLDDPRIMSASEAAKKWGISDARLRQVISDFPKGTFRKFGKQWVVTEEGMEAVFGKLKFEEMLKMKITEYTVLDFKGSYNEGTEGEVNYHYNVIKLGDNMYYKGYDDDKAKVTSDIRFASHIAPEFGEETVQFIKKFYDEFGQRKQ